VSYGEVLVDESAIDLILRVLDYIVTISFGYILYCVCFHVYCGCFKLFCNVWVCVGFVMCVFWYYVYQHFSATLTEVFPCFFLSCKANARVKLAEMGHGPHSSQLVVICVVLCIVCL